MAAQILDGIACAKAVKSEVAAEVARLRAQGVTPGLGTILVGDDAGSHKYVAGKHKDCAEVGIESIQVYLPADAGEAAVAAAIDELNADPACTGFIVQLPVPGVPDTEALLARIDPSKDADGLHPANLGMLVLSTTPRPGVPVPCTPRGIVELVERNGLSWRGKKVCVVGRGVTVGRPLSLLLTQKHLNATVTCVHTGTVDIAHEVREADVVVAAVGQPHFIKPEWVKPGAIVLDVGVSRGEVNGKPKILGDVDPAVADVAGWISPNPGGVGPMTRAMLLANVVALAQK